MPKCYICNKKEPNKNFVCKKHYEEVLKFKIKYNNLLKWKEENQWRLLPKKGLE